MRKVFEIALGVIFGALVGLLIGGLLYLTTRQPVGQKVELMPSSTPEPIVVYVTGAVQRPGVYRVPRDSRLVEAVALAGGFLEGADVTQLNLAEKLEDGKHIEIPGGNTDLPTPQLIIGGGGLLVTPTPPAGQLVNINTADAALLEKLPGIGPTTAAKIVQYRDDNGPFEKVDDLLKVPGIGPETLDKLRGLITVGQ
jgi:competence protein ComEA